jgi:hypothetical protein
MAKRKKLSHNFLGLKEFEAMSLKLCRIDKKLLNMSRTLSSELNFF